jgi:hypothetical protein
VSGNSHAVEDRDLSLGEEAAECGHPGVQGQIRNSGKRQEILSIVPECRTEPQVAIVLVERDHGVETVVPSE